MADFHHDFVLIVLLQLCTAFCIHIGQFPSYHKTDHFVFTDLGYFFGDDMFSVSHNRECICNFVDFVHFMRNIYNRLLLFFQLSYHLEQLLHFSFRNGRSRLVHNDDIRIKRNSLYDCHHLHLGNTQFSHFFQWRNVYAKLLKQLPCSLYHGLFMDNTGFYRQFLTRKDIFCHCQLRNKIQFLRNHGNPSCQCLCRTFGMKHTSIQQNLSPVQR